MHPRQNVHILSTMAYNFTEEQIREAIAEGGGTIAQVAKRLQCSWLTARKYIDEYELRGELPEAQGMLGEMAEETIYLMLAHAMTDLEYAATVKTVIIFTAKAQANWAETSNLNVNDSRAPHDILLEALDKMEEQPADAPDEPSADDPNPGE